MLSCSQYDELEVVCLYRYPIELVLKDSSSLEGVAIDIQYNTLRQECLTVQIIDGKKYIPFNDVLRLNVCVKNAKVQQISFV
ncbi:Rho-binding antiterminator [Paraglaciecola sp. 2405UD69-4]|uniref:Rho-binding antiterminator n=1 Tax=Paraglaciecola sp. 2405UD69-4 TaxID=3391836 RepID=UPI0039C8E9C4